MAARSIWKGYLRLSLVNCSVALYPAVTAATKVHFHKLNRETGNRLRMRMVDEETGEEVPREQQVKGYQISKGSTVEVEEEDLEKIALESTRIMEITKFVPREEIDPLYFDRPYFLAPNDDASQEAFAVIRDAMRKKEIGGLATVIMHERDHVVLLEPRESGMLATTLRSPEEVRDAKDVFRGTKSKVGGELLEVAQMLIEKKMGKFQPSEFKDHYETALKALIKAKKAGRKIKEFEPPETPAKPSSVLEALRESLKQGGRAHPRRTHGTRRGGQRARPGRTGAAAKKRA
ncbi:MAG TPA: Ku protein [Xanthobacteraceae bacterium]|nr:Ku protein [Xanthobacteraceae bacterium]